eukprot:TRINITY_DN78_c0_g1_i1.p1 TRINITY_DN78_c0_g1~~TRINITY_DN78_c0_g1_i1.p1  ORF type:complete len:2462 (-),score=272.77 TRINITY_DN78_c0_g1_i1:2173-9558(-)
MSSKSATNDNQAESPKEGLADKTLYQQAEEYNFTKDIKVGTYLDVKDTASTWCLAQVIRLSGDVLRVHYDGWSEKYDEVLFQSNTQQDFRTFSQRIAPFRKYTRGYTGQKSTALRYTCPTLEEIQDATHLVQKLTESNLTSITAKEYNQFVRGALFVLMDFLMTNWPGKKEIFKGEVEAILGLCNAVIKFVCKWLSLFPKYYPYYIEAMQHPNLYLVSLNHAVAVSLPELSEMLKLNFGLIKRCENTFFILAKELSEKPFGMTPAKSAARGSVGNVLQRLNISVFQENKGFELVIGLVKNTEQQYPLTVIIDLLEPLAGALRALKDEFSKQYSNDILKEITDRFSTLNNKEIKEMTKPTLDKLFYTLESLKTIKDSTTGGREAVLAVIFAIAVQLIKSAYIQKKLLGLSIIKEMLPKQGKGTSLVNMEWKDPKQLIKAMEDHKLLDIILGENAHAELLRKVQDIFVFLLANDKLEPKHIELLWRCSSEKYEDIMRACLGLLCNLVSKMSYPLIQELFKHIEATNIQSEIMIKFLETYTLNVLQVCTERDNKNTLMGKKKAESAAYKLFNLDLFWNLLLDSSQISGKLKDQVMEALIGILNKYPVLANEYVMKAAECIKNEQIVIRGIQLLKDIDFAAYYVDRGGRREFFYKLGEMNSTYSIIKNTLKDCETYHARIRKEIAAAPDKKSSVMDTDFGTGFTFAEQARLYIEFFEYYCSKGSLTLSKEDFLGLWRSYVENAFCESHADILFNSMMKEVKASYADHKFVLFSDKVAQAVFEELLCAPEAGITKLTPFGFACFRTYMLWINQREPVTPSKVQKSVLELYQGFPTLWSIAFHSEVNAIKGQAKEFLVNLIDRICLRSKIRRREITEKALEVALDNVKDLENVAQIKTALDIINSIIGKIECLSYEEVGPMYAYPPLTTFYLYSHPGAKPTVLQINENMKLSNLRCLLSNMYKVHKSRIVLRGYVSRMEYSDECDYYLTSFKRLTDNKLLVDFKKNEIPLKETPRFILANSAIFTRLQELLKSPKEEIVDEVWKLILTLPLNEDVRERLRKLALPEATDSATKIQEWEKYLDGQESIQLVYYLYVLDKLIGDKENQLYSEKFLKKGGAAFLLSVFGKKKAGPKTRLNLKCLEYCIRIISVYILPETYATVFEGAGSDVAFWKDIVGLIEWISKQSENEENIVDETEKEIYTDLAGIFAACCEAHYAMLKAQAKFIANATNKEYVEILKQCLLRNKDVLVRKDTCRLLQELVLEILKPAELKKLQKELMNVLILDFLKAALEEGVNAEPYFDLMSELIVFTLFFNPVQEKSDELDCPTLIKEKHIPYLIHHILNRPTFEKNMNDIDHCLGGLMDMLRLEILKHSPLKSEIKNAPELSTGILEALFNIDKADSKCKNEKSRGKALKLLEVIVNNFPQTYTLVRDYLCTLHISGNWRTNKKADWNIRPGLGNRAGNFVGLKNLGATCYMNSSLQQLFMIPQFRKGIVEADHSKKGQEQSVLFQLQLIFSSLLASQRAVYNPRAFTQTIKMDGRVLNVIEQKDVDEFLTHLLDQLEQELKGSSQAKLVNDLFKLTFANEIICKDCPHRSETHEEAISVILSVKNKKTIHEGLKAYVQSDTLEGDNAYYCERCDKKVAAYKRQNIKTLPNVLIIVLKRFEFNVETMAKVKVNDYCEFPSDLDLEEFTQEGQTCKELNKDLESGKIAQEDLTEDQKRLLQRKIPKYYYKYRLKGIIVHSGHVDSGHYYSYILNRENPEQPEEKRWLEFNDTIVRNFDPKDIPDETFGGEEEMYYSAWGKKETTREKIRNAYVLIYERTVPLSSEALAKYKGEEREVDPAEVEKKFDAMRIKEEKMETQIPEILQKMVHQDNKKFWLTQYIFHPNYLSFVFNIMKKHKVIEDNNYVDGRENIQAKIGANVDAAQFATIFLLTTALRAENKEMLPGLLNYIKACCGKNIKLCLWICHLFSCPEIIQEFLTECPHDNVRRWVAGLLYCAMKQLYPLEKSAILRLVQKPETVMFTKLLCKEVDLPDTIPMVGNKIMLTNEKHKIPYLLLMMDAFVQQLSSLPEHNCGQFFQVFCYFARLGPEASKYLKICPMLGVAFEFLIPTKGKCTQFCEKYIAHIELKTPVPIGVMTKEHVYISKKALLAKKPLQHIFLFELMYRLLTSAETTQLKKAPSKEDEVIRSKFNDTEELYLSALKEGRTIDSLLPSCYESKVSLTYLSKMLAYLSFNSEEYIISILEYVLSKIMVVESLHLRLFFRIIFFLLANQDRYPTKFHTFIKNFHECFLKSTSYFRIAESFIDLLIKMCRENAVFLGILRQDKFPEHGQLLKQMEEWLKKYPYPGYFFPVFFIHQQPLGHDIQEQDDLKNCHWPNRRTGKTLPPIDRIPEKRDQNNKEIQRETRPRRKQRRRYVHQRFKVQAKRKIRPATVQQSNCQQQKQTGQEPMGDSNSSNSVRRGSKV